ncbi:MAG: hypothetical protein GXO91_08995 [FCB group bacterium]|nr:hypothetical protein [FCB group bacterium]
MRQFATLLRREWWEWQKTVYWTMGIFSVLLLLSLFPVNRLSTAVNNKFDTEQLQDEGEIIINGRDILPDLKKNGGIDGLKKTLSEKPQKVLVPYGYTIVTGFHILQIIVLFIALFYFSDSLFKERSDGSTLYYRSQPVGDHCLLLSKVAAGIIGILGVSIIMSFVLLTFTKLDLMVMSGKLSDLLLPVLGRLRVLDLFKDMLVFQFVSILWLSPLIMFLIFVSSAVKNRPLIIGIGGPILLAIVIQLIFSNHDIFNVVVTTFRRIGEIQNEQMLLDWDMPLTGGQVSVFGSFSQYFFTLRTLFSLGISAVIYGLTWFMYHRNLTTS